MIKLLPGEKFRDLTLDGKLSLNYAISNHGRLVSYSESIKKDARLLEGGLIKGYRVMRYKVKQGKKLVYKQKLFFRMVAETFLKPKTANHAHVIHLDFDRANDKVSNLKWVTWEEMQKHHAKSPARKAQLLKLQELNRQNPRRKLSIAQVKTIKKELQNPKRKLTIRAMAEKYGVSEMQLYRIKSGENWGHLK